jgi:hypothetical protein
VSLVRGATSRRKLVDVAVDGPRRSVVASTLSHLRDGTTG